VGGPPLISDVRHHKEGMYPTLEIHVNDQLACRAGGEYLESDGISILTANIVISKVAKRLFCSGVKESPDGGLVHIDWLKYDLNIGDTIKIAHIPNIGISEPRYIVSKPQDYDYQSAVMNSQSENGEVININRLKLDIQMEDHIILFGSDTDTLQLDIEWSNRSDNIKVEAGVYSIIDDGNVVPNNQKIGLLNLNDIITAKLNENGV